MATIGRLEIAKVVVAPGIALFVALVGWTLTSRYNTTQLEVATKRGNADIEIARMNAAMRYLELVRNLPGDADRPRLQALAIAAPALPPDLAFRLAVDELPHSTDVLDALMPKYGADAFKYLARHLEVPFSEMQRTIDPISTRFPASLLAVQQSEQEQRAALLLRYLRDRGQASRLFDHLVSRDYTSEQFRPIALFLYFDEFRSSLQNDTGYVVQQVYEQARVKDEFKSYMDNRSLSSQAKQSIALAAALVFRRSNDYYIDAFTREAATRFWDNVNVARGLTPVEGSLQGYVYEHVFGTDELVRADAIGLSSANLRDAIRKLDFAQISFDNVRLILYAYATSPTVGGDPAYLMPPDVVDVMRTVVSWANTPDRRQALSEELGSLGGQHLFLNMLPSSQRRRVYGGDEEEVNRGRCEAARTYGELLLDWYAKYHVPSWFIPSFFDEVVNEFPDLEGRMDRETWGLGQHWSSETSRGCRS